MTEVLLIILTVLLCLIGLLISTLAFSGTWLVLLAAFIIKFTNVACPPDCAAIGWGSLVVFALICIAVELIELLAGFLGVQKRGGSKLAGFAALVGGLVGAGVGTGIFPILGTFAGMLIGSFGAAFLVEWNRLKHHEQAAHIAWGTVWARLAVLFLKTTFTLGMSLWLLVGLIK